LAQAEEGLLHVMGVLRERDEVREEFEQSTRAGSDRRNGDGMRVELLRAESRPKIWIDVPIWDAITEFDTPLDEAGVGSKRAAWPRRDARDGARPNERLR
jgi:hypothetical protein